MEAQNISSTLAPNEQDDTAEAEALAVLCKALAHPARVRIVKYLRQQDRCVCGKIVEMLPLAQSTVSQHLKCLKDAGLIKGDIEGQNVCYCLNAEALGKLKELVDEL